MPTIGNSGAIGNVGDAGKHALTGARAERSATAQTAETPAAKRPRQSARQVPGQVPGSGWQRGKIEISPRAIATVAGRAVANSYGVVGIAARHPRFTSVELLAPDQYNRGVDVRFGHDHVIIDLYVMLEHGLRITTIAHNIMANVKFAVERTLGLR